MFLYLENLILFDIDERFVGIKNGIAYYSDEMMIVGWAMHALLVTGTH
jgi:hypothetical protein